MNGYIIGQDGTGDSINHNLLELAKLVGIRSETSGRHPFDSSVLSDSMLREDIDVVKGRRSDNNDSDSNSDSNSDNLGDHLEDNVVPEDVMCRCGGDNLDCYRVAQQELMYLISTSSSVAGCSVVLTGDFHWSDIKQLTHRKKQLHISQTHSSIDGFGDVDKYRQQCHLRQLSSGPSWPTNTSRMFIRVWP